MTQEAPRLPEFIEDGQTLRPDALVDQEFSILESIVVLRKDGTNGHKWVVRHSDGQLGLYWAPGTAEPFRVQQWFRTNPGRELHVTLSRLDLGQGYQGWRLQQRAVAEQPAAPAGADEAVDQVPF